MWVIIRIQQYFNVKIYSSLIVLVQGESLKVVLMLYTLIISFMNCLMFLVDYPIQLNHKKLTFVLGIEIVTYGHFPYNMEELQQPALQNCPEKL